MLEFRREITSAALADPKCGAQNNDNDIVIQYISIAFPLHSLALSALSETQTNIFYRLFCFKCGRNKRKRREAARRCTRKRTELRYGRQTLSPVIKSISSVAYEADSFHILAHQFVMPTPTFFHLDDDKFRYISGIWLPNHELMQASEECLRNLESRMYTFASLTCTFYISLLFFLLSLSAFSVSIYINIVYLSISIFVLFLSTREGRKKRTVS